MGLVKLKRINRKIIIGNHHEKARHPVGLFRISHFRYNSCPTSRPDA